MNEYEYEYDPNAYAYVTSAVLQITHRIQAVNSIRRETGLSVKKSEVVLDTIERDQLNRQLRDAGVLPVIKLTAELQAKLDRYETLKAKLDH